MEVMGIPVGNGYQHGLTAIKSADCLFTENDCDLLISVLCPILCYMKLYNGKISFWLITTVAKLVNILKGISECLWIS